MATSRTEFKAVADAREQEAKELLREGYWSGAYYLSGYAVECALKAVLASQFKADTFPDRDLVKRAFQHSLEGLLKAAGLGQQHARAIQADRNLWLNWVLAKDWDEQSRYRTWTQPEAEDMVTAVTDQQNGVMQWLRTVW